LPFDAIAAGYAIFSLSARRRRHWLIVFDIDELVDISLLMLASLGFDISLAFAATIFASAISFSPRRLLSPAYFIFLSLFIFERFLQDTPAAAAGHYAFDIAAGDAADAFS
jgi:hypothetical protein